MSIEVVAPATLDELHAAIRVVPTPTGVTADGQFAVVRGCSVATWALQHSLARCGGDLAIKEGDILKQFAVSGAKDLAANSVDVDDYLSLMAYGQHYGVPTRLLDWSKSPDVGLHFATESLVHAMDSGAVWVVNPHLVHAALSEAVRKKVSPARPADPPVLGQADIRSAFETVEDLDFQFVSGVYMPTYFFEPPRMDDRMFNQRGLFSLVGSPLVALNDIFEKIEGCCRKIIVSPDLKVLARQQLDSQDFDERGYFPGLDGIGRYLSRVHRT